MVPSDFGSGASNFGEMVGDLGGDPPWFLVIERVVLAEEGGSVLGSFGPILEGSEADDQALFRGKAHEIRGRAGRRLVGVRLGQDGERFFKSLCGDLLTVRLERMKASPDYLFLNSFFPRGLFRRLVLR